MQKLLVALISVVTLMGLVAPSSANVIQGRNGDRLARGDTPLVPARRDDGGYPQPSHRFKHKHDGQHDQRDLSKLPPTRRDYPNHPEPSHHFNDHGHHNNHQERNSDRLARGLPPLPPARRDNARYPFPSHRFNHKDHGHDGLPPSRRDNARYPEPSHHFKHKHNGQGDDENDPPTRRDDARYPQPSHRFKHKHNGQGDDENDSPTRRDNARYPQPSHHFKYKHQERNSDRLARGLPPLPPSRRNSARSPQPSYKHQGDGTGHLIEVRDTSGKSLGYLEDFTGSGQDLSVNYNSGSHTLSFHGNGLGDAHFVGASVSQTDLGSNSPAFVYLTNVRAHDPQANANIWSLNGNQLTATWMNSDGTTTPVHFCLNIAENSFVLAGNPSLLPPGYQEVYFNLDK